MSSWNEKKDKNKTKQKRSRSLASTPSNFLWWMRERNCVEEDSTINSVNISTLRAECNVMLCVDVDTPKWHALHRKWKIDQKWMRMWFQTERNGTAWIKWKHCGCCCCRYYKVAPWIILCAIASNRCITSLPRIFHFSWKTFWESSIAHLRLVLQFCAIVSVLLIWRSIFVLFLHFHFIFSHIC